MSNGNGVQSVSLADGTLSPDLRVNYAFGLVLGVNEFRQEQDYLLQKAYLYNRALQGYGTVSGLHVRADWQKGEEVLITVSPGMAIDQFGMPIVVRDAQCARLTAWLSKQEAQQAGTVGKHRRKGEKWEHLWKMGEKRDLRVYIIARYEDYADGQVPIAGQACSTSDTQPIYSRIHDSYTIDFSWDPPSLPAWESVRCFSKLLAQVRFVDDEGRDDTDEFIKQVLKLADPGSIPFCTSPAVARKRDNDDKHEKDGEEEHHQREDEDDEEPEPRWYIPSANARESLDRIFMTWVTRVRPQLLPGLLDPAQAGTTAQPDILLAHIDFKLDDGFDDTDPRIEEHGFDPPDNNGRPFLLPVQVMQELLLAGQRESERIDGEGHALPAREFATLQVRNNHTLHAWVHHSRQMFIEGDKDDWSRMLEVRSNGQSLAIAHVREIEKNVFEVEVKGEEEQQGRGVLMVPGARVELVFKADEIRVERVDDDDDGEEDEDLGEKVEEKLKDVGHEVKEEVKEAGEKVETKVEEAEDVVKQVAGEIQKGVGAVVEDVGEAEKKIGKALERTIGIGRDAEKSGAKLEKTGKKIEKEGQEQVVDAGADEKRLEKKERADEVKDEEEEERRRRPKLSRSIRRLGFNYVDYDREQKIVVVYTIAAHIPVRELATFFVYDAQSDEADAPNLPHAELKKVTTSERFLALWFHTEYPVILPQQVRVMRVFMHQQPEELMMRAVAPAGQTFSWFWALESPEGGDELKLVPGELLAVIFDTNEIGVVREENSRALTRVMKETPFTCVGYDGNHSVEIYHQVSFSGRRDEEKEPPTGKLAVDQPPAPANNATTPMQPFVTIIVTRLKPNDEGPTEADLELWFHLSTNAAEDRIGFTEDLTFDALLEDGRQMRTTRVEATAPTRVQHNVYTSMVTLPAPGEDQRGYYLRLRFSLDANPVNVRGVRTSYKTLREYIEATGIRFEGYNGDDSVLAYVRAAAPHSNTGRTAQATR